MYLVDGQRYGPDGHGLERALAAAYDDRIRPLCLCCDPAVPVYITRLGGNFVLKRMPFTGSRHAVGCSHYESPSELSKLGEVLGTAICEDPDTGVTQLRVGFALSKGTSRAVEPGGGQGSRSIRSDGTRLSLRGLLHFLWQESQLTRWHPGFAGKRTWAVVRSHLLAAAANKIVRGVSLMDVLYVPEPFTVANRDEIDVRRMRRFANGLQRRGDSRSLMLLIGEVRKIVPARDHFKVLVKHMPDQAFRLDGQLHRFTVMRFERELSMCGSSSRTIVIASFGLGTSGLPTIEELSLVPVTLEWLPVEDIFERQLVDRLVRERRMFDKTFRFNAAGQLSVSAIALDALGSPVPLFIQRVGGVPPAFRANVPSWVWEVGQSQMPPLPKRRAESPFAST